ncbi:hypothetical protein [Caldivirga sp. UBA161]|uniref:hypothetical protein n=1 Tax=Caldivirga sp. UBA161 TaxID=1915569 RepID=UPI0025C5BD2F|nr:hypothetical protein [Caldivirga sp. UBA161]
MAAINLIPESPINVKCGNGQEYLIILMPQYMSNLINGGGCVKAVMLPKGLAGEFHTYLELVSFLVKNNVRLIVPLSELNSLSELLRRRLIIVPHIDDSRFISKISELERASFFANASLILSGSPRLKEVFIHLLPPRLRRGFNLIYGTPTIQADLIYMVHYP